MTRAIDGGRVCFFWAELLGSPAVVARDAHNLACANVAGAAAAQHQVLRLSAKGGLWEVKLEGFDRNVSLHEVLKQTPTLN